jgi:hypothetical protein
VGGLAEDQARLAARIHRNMTELRPVLDFRARFANSRPAPSEPSSAIRTNLAPCSNPTQSAEIIGERVAPGETCGSQRAGNREAEEVITVTGGPDCTRL